MRSAIADLKLTRLYVLHAGRLSFDLAPKVRCVAPHDLLDEL
jgi:hypothetical protein